MTFTIRVPQFRRPKLPKVRVPRVPSSVAETAAQGIGVIAVLVGVSMWSVPSAWILGGLTVVFAIERQGV